MDPSQKPLAFPVPEWLAPHTEPNIEAIVSLLGGDTVRLYRRFLAEEVRSPHPALLPPCLRAFDRATCDVHASQECLPDRRPPR